MTKLEAADITIEVWTYLRDHPAIDSKTGLPKRLFRRIKNLPGRCAICAVVPGPCDDCPLYVLKKGCHDFSCWVRAYSEADRAYSAGEIVRKTTEWREKLLKDVKE